MSKVVKILSVCSSDTQGGAARAAKRIHDGVNTINCDVQSTMFVKSKQSNDVTVHSVDEFLPHNKLYKLLVWIRTKLENKYWHHLWHPYNKTQDKNFKSDLRGCDIGSAFKKLEYDVLHLHWINNRFIRLEDIPSDKPIVWTLHDSWQFCGECHYFLDCERYKQQCGCCPQLGSQNTNDLSHKQWLAKHKCYSNKNIHVVCPSKWLADCAAESSLFRGCDIRVIPNCLDTDVFKPIDISEVPSAMKQNVAISRILRATGEKAQKPIILYGAMNAATDRIKGLASLLSALKILDSQGCEANLIVFGANATDLPLKFKNINVTFVGYISDTESLVWLYNVATVMVVPSYTENLSCAIMESLSCGTPVCCFDIGGNGDMVTHKINGYIAEPLSENDLTNGIKWIVAHNRKNAMQQQVRKSVVERFSVPVVARKYAELYRELI